MRLLLLNFTLLYDWSGTVGPARQQHKCGSCYSFAISGLCEHAHYTRHGRVVQYSADELVDCFPHGRCGATPDKILERMRRRGCVLESRYAGHAGCFVRQGLRVRNVEAYDDLSGEDVEPRIDLSKGPWVVGIPSRGLRQMTGVVASVSGVADHAVLLTGEAERDGVRYWVARNSWGPNWGLNGYFLVEKGTIHYACRADFV